MFILLLCGSLQAGAQLINNNSNRENNGMRQNVKPNTNDSTKAKQVNTDDRIRIRMYYTGDSSQVFLDTGIQFIHRNPLVPGWFSDLGNLGSSGTSLKFEPEMHSGMDLGMQAIRPYLYRWEDAAFYNTTRPFTEVYYRIGTKNEQILSMMHTQNVKPGWNLAAAYRKINSPGFYKWQKTNHDQFRFTTHYLSRDLRYDLKAGLFYNKMQQDENGGIIGYDYLFATNYNDKRLVPVYFENISANRSSVTNYFRNVSLNLQQQYYFGKSDSVFNADSTALSYRFQPVFSLRHQLYTHSDYYRFNDVKPDSNAYFFLPPSVFQPNDSLYVKYFHRRLGNAFSLHGDVRLGKKIVQAAAGYGIEIDRLKNVFLEEYYYNNYLFAQLIKPRQEEREWIFRADARIYFTGIAKGNFNLHAEAGRSMGEKRGTVVAGLEQALQSAPYMYLFYASNYFTLQNNFSKQSISRVFLRYHNPQYFTGIGFNYYMLGNMLYRDTLLQAKQYGPLTPLIQIQVNKDLHLGQFVIGNEVLLQWISNNSPVKVPLFASRHRLAYESFIFKKKLQVATGFEIRYNSPYYAYRYSPLFYNFLTQGAERISNIPEFAYFFNFKIKTFRASVALDQLQQLLTGNVVRYPSYAAQNFGFRFGLSWMFVN